jgi:hypothetical protein
MPDSTAPRDPEAAEPEEPDEAAEPEVFENRAARRAKGKGAAASQVSGKAKRIAGRGSVPAPRNWGTRRSG